MAKAMKTLGSDGLRAERSALSWAVMSVEKMGGAPNVMQLSGMGGWPRRGEERIGSREGVLLISSINLLALGRYLACPTNVHRVAQDAKWASRSCNLAN